MQVTLAVLLTLSGLGCHHKAPSVSYVDSCYSSCYSAPVVESCYSSGYSSCYTSCYSSCYTTSYSSCYSSCYSSGYTSAYASNCNPCGIWGKSRNSGGGLFHALFSKHKCAPVSPMVIAEPACGSCGPVVSEVIMPSSQMIAPSEQAVPAAPSPQLAPVTSAKQS